MNSYHTPDAYAVDNRPSVAAVGNFDGVHQGHALLINEVVKQAREHRCTAMAVTFEPHTRTLISKNDQPILSTLNEKTILLERLGIDALVCIPFNDEIRNLSADQFVQQILVEKLHAHGMVMGRNHAFGKNRSGNKNSLHKASGRNDILMFPVNLHGDREQPFSSTDIRSLVTGAEIRKAVEKLGHPYLIRVRRIAGVKVGTKIGFPTLNFSLPDTGKVLPPAGVFAAKMELNGAMFKGALYLGDCPTFGKRDVHFEFHLLDPLGAEPAPGEEASLWISEYIRPDRTFPSQDDLIRQIQIDTTTISQFFDGS